MTSLHSRLTKSKSPDLRRGRWITLGSALVLWLLLAAFVVALLPTWVLAAETRDRDAKANAHAIQLTGRIAERLKVLRFLATVPSVAQRTSAAQMLLRSFADEYPEFSRVYIDDGLPPIDKGHPLFLAAPIKGGGLVIGTLDRDWTDRILVPGERFGEDRSGHRTILVSPSGLRSPSSATPPAWDGIVSRAGSKASVVSWGEAGPQLTSVARVGESLPRPHPPLLVVSSIPSSTIEARVATLRRRTLVSGLVVGLICGLAGCVVLGWATRWLREANEALERRVEERTAELQNAERSYRDIFENVPLGLYECDPNGRFLRVNPTLARTLGFGSPEALVAGLGSLQAVGDREARAEFLRRIVEDGEALEKSTLAVRADGHSLWLAERARAVRDSDGKILLIEGTMHDVTAQHELETRLRQIGATDPLTGLLNRRGLADAIEAAQAPVSIVTLDVDRFKAFNDAYGHPAGDRALQAVADALREVVREGDAVARAGGEEFVVVLSKTGVEGARRVAEGLREAVAACDVLETRLTVSGGVATAATVETVEETFAAADRALYLAKQGGRDRIVVNPAKLA